MSTAANWPVFTAKLHNRREVAERTMAFQFEKPSGWTFRPGQFVDITLVDPSETDAEGNTRGFSIASAPHESFLMVATRLRDTAFKRVLKALPLGSEVKIEGPFGDLALHHNADRPAVFLAGGIGITPIRSILLDAARQKLPHRIVLFYSNRRPEDSPFLDELQALERENPNYKLVATMTEMGKSLRLWKGKTGFIDYGMVSNTLKSIASASWYSAGPIYYITGPPQMVHGVHTMLVSSGVDSDDIRTEEFSGY